MVFDRKNASELCLWFQQGTGETLLIEHGKIEVLSCCSPLMLAGCPLTVEGCIYRVGLTSYGPKTRVQISVIGVHSFLMKYWR